MFGLNDILHHLGLGRVWFGSRQFQVNQFLVKHARHAKTSNFVENFGSSMAQLGSIRISGLLSGEHISGVGSGMHPSCSVRVSDLGLVLPGLVSSIFHMGINLSSKMNALNISAILLSTESYLAYAWKRSLQKCLGALFSKNCHVLDIFIMIELVRNFKILQNMSLYCKSFHFFSS